LDDPTGYVANGGSDTRIYFVAFLELLLIVANIGTAVVVYPMWPGANDHRRPRVDLGVGARRLRDFLGIQSVVSDPQPREPRGCHRLLTTSLAAHSLAWDNDLVCENFDGGLGET
jgi:hypothetical protein